MNACPHRQGNTCELVTLATNVRFYCDDNNCAACQKLWTDGPPTVEQPNTVLRNMIGSAKRRAAAVKQRPSVNFTGPGVGDRLKELIAARMTCDFCEACEAELERMNRDGPEKCRKRIEQIVAGMWPRALKCALLDASWSELWTEAKNLRNPLRLKAEIRKLVNQAIDETEAAGPPRPFDERITVGVTAFQRPDKLRQFLRSLWYWHPTARVIIADNGNQQLSDSEVAALAGAAEWKYRRLPFDAGLSASRNAIIEAMETPMLLLCEDDLAFSPDVSIPAMLDVLESRPDVGVVCGRMGSGEGAIAWNLRLVENGPGVWNEPITDWLTTPGGTRYSIHDGGSNFALFRREMLAEHRWDDSLKIGEHDAYYWNVKRAGKWRVAYTDASAIIHDHGPRGTSEYERHRNRAQAFATQYRTTTMGHGLPPLLPDSAFAHVFEPLRGFRCGIVDANGNAGDRIIHEAARQLCIRFGVDWVAFDPRRDGPAGLDKLLLFGGGNMGTPYEEGRRIRHAALDTGLPCVLLPQSWWEAESIDRYERAFARDALSAAFSGATLAPDLALGWACPFTPDAATEDVGVYLRVDIEAAVEPGGRVDPIKLAKSTTEYIRLAAKYRHVITDRLHFAIAGLIARRRVTLLPNAYRKNRGMWASWLRGLGCEWAESPP